MCLSPSLHSGDDFRLNKWQTATSSSYRVGEAYLTKTTQAWHNNRKYTPRSAQKVAEKRELLRSDGMFSFASFFALFLFPPNYVARLNRKRYLFADHITSGGHITTFSFILSSVFLLVFHSLLAAHFLLSIAINSNTDTRFSFAFFPFVDCIAVRINPFHNHIRFV